MPERDWHWDDLVRGPITFAHEHVPDYVIVRGNGEPLYTLVNPWTTPLMRITHVLRARPALLDAPAAVHVRGARRDRRGDAGRPGSATCPMSWGGNKKLSKRDPQSSLNNLPGARLPAEGLLNYLALLGWSMGEDARSSPWPRWRRRSTLDRVSANPARFDLKKCEAINAVHVRALATEDLAMRSGAGAAGVRCPAARAERAQLGVLRAARRWCRSAWSCSPRRPACSPSLRRRGHGRAGVAGRAGRTPGRRSPRLRTRWPVGGLDSWRHRGGPARCLVDGSGAQAKLAFTPPCARR